MTLPSVWFAQICLYVVLFKANGRRREEGGNDDKAMIIDTEILKRGEQRQDRNTTKANRSIDASGAKERKRQSPSSYAVRSKSHGKEKTNTISSLAALHHAWQSLDLRSIQNQSTSHSKGMTITSSSLAELQHLLRSMVSTFDEMVNITYVWAALSLFVCACMCCSFLVESNFGKRLSARLESEELDEENEDQFVTSTSERSRSERNRSFFTKARRGLRRGGNQRQPKRDEDDDGSQSPGTSSWKLTGSESIAKWSKPPGTLSRHEKSPLH